MAEIDALLATLKQLAGSDLHITAGLAARYRVDGAIVTPDSAVLRPEDTQRILYEIMPAASRTEFEATSDTDFAYEVGGLARFRVNLFRDLRGTGGVFRLVPATVPDADSLGLPQAVRNFCDLPNGLVLVTGPTGSGKSTTLAAMIDLVNARRQDHIITVEDPIEYVHASKKCLVNQRQLHAHTGSFARALRAALREDPDVMLVGEMRDLETTRIAIEMAETGHLVFATLHTRTAPSTVDRLIGQFPAGEQEQIRLMASGSLKGVVSQTLLRRKTSGRVAAFEVLVVNAAVQNTIREGKLHQIQSLMQVGAKFGMGCLNESLLRLVVQGVVDPETALAKAQDRDDLQAKIRLATGGPGGLGAAGAAPAGTIRPGMPLQRARRV